MPLCETETNYDSNPSIKRVVRILTPGSYVIIEADTTVPIIVQQNGDVFINLENHYGPLDNISVQGIGFESLGSFKNVVVTPKNGEEVLMVYDAEATGVGRSRNVELVSPKKLKSPNNLKLISG